MKTMTKLSTAMALTFGAFVSTVSAADIEAGVVKNTPVFHGDKSSHKTLGKLDLSNISLIAADKLANEQTLGPAQGITLYEIYAIGSSTQGWKYPTASQTSTTYDHGGSALRVATIQYGYGNPNQATLNGLSRSSYGSDSLCGSLATLHFCSTGETVTGFVYYFNFDGQQEGFAKTSANSIANPFGYWSDSIYIR